MDDLATLRLAVDSRQVASATKALTSFSTAATKAQSAVASGAGRMSTAFSAGMGKIQSATARATDSLKGFGTQANLIKAMLTGAAITGFIRYADSFTRIQNQLKVAGLEGAALTGTFEKLFRIAQAQGVAIEPLSTLYGKMAAAQKDLGATTAEMVKFTELTAMALRVQGTSAEAASGALLQLSQALGSGKVQAEEFNSIIEGARPLLIAVANGLDEAGGSLSKLKAIVVDGGLTSEEFFKAGLKGYSSLAAQAALATDTISQGFTKVQNSATLLAGAMNEVTGAGSKAGTGLGKLADYIEHLAADKQKLAETLEMLKQIAGVVGGIYFGRMLGGAPGMVLGALVGTIAANQKTNLEALTEGLANMKKEVEDLRKNADDPGWVLWGVAGTPEERAAAIADLENSIRIAEGFVNKLRTAEMKPIGVPTVPGGLTPTEVLGGGVTAPPIQLPTAIPEDTLRSYERWMGLTGDISEKLVQAEQKLSAFQEAMGNTAPTAAQQAALDAMRMVVDSLARGVDSSVLSLEHGAAAMNAYTEAARKAGVEVGVVISAVDALRQALAGTPIPYSEGLRYRFGDAFDTPPRPFEQPKPPGYDPVRPWNTTGGGGSGSGGAVGTTPGASEALRRAIGAWETRGYSVADSYRARGAAGEYGRYQIMEANIGPWSKEALDYEVSPQAFLNSPEIQDKIAQFKVNQYYEKYGLEGAIRAWNSGSPKGRTTEGYVPGVMGMLQKGAGFDTGIGAGVDNDLALEEWEKQKEALEALQTAADDAAQSMYDALVSFADGSATAQEALGGLAGAFAKAFAEAKGFGELGQPISDAISGLIDGTKTASEALKELAASFALAAAKALLLGQGPFANMLVGGAGGGAFNTITNALFGAGGRAATAAPAAFGGALSGTGGLFHTGGIITAHSGASPGVGSLGGLFGISGGGGGGGGKRNSDERLIIAQTGEKIQSRNDVAWGKSSQGQMFQYYFNPIINASGVPHAGMFQQLVDMMRSLLQSEMPTAVRRARQNREI